MYCRSEKTHKSGKIRGKQRYKCKDCGKNFLETDGRIKETTIAKRALAVMLYTFSLAKLHGLRVTVMLQPLKNCTNKLNT